MDMIKDMVNLGIKVSLIGFAIFIAVVLLALSFAYSAGKKQEKCEKMTDQVVICDGVKFIKQQPYDPSQPVKQ